MQLQQGEYGGGFPYLYTSLSHLKGLLRNLFAFFTSTCKEVF